MRKNFFKTYSLPIIAGIIYSLILPFPSFKLLVIPALFLFLYFLMRIARTAREALLGMWLGFFVFVVASLWQLRFDHDAWLYVLSHFVNPHLIIWSPVIFFFLWLFASLWLSFPYALFGFFFWRLRRNVFSDVFLAAALFALAELLRTLLSFGIGWVDAGYWFFAAFPSLTLPFARFGGVLGSDFLAAVMAGLLLFGLRLANNEKSIEHERAHFFVVVLLLSGAWAWGSHTMSAEQIMWRNAPRTAFALQGFISWTGSPRTNEAVSGLWLPEGYSALVAKIPSTPHSLIVFPEEILPTINPSGALYQWTEETLGFEKLRQSLGADLLLVGQSLQRNERRFNASLIFDGTDATPKVYEKSKLLPIAEYIPPGLGFLHEEFPSAPFSAPGTAARPVPTKIGTIGVFSCFELLLPDFVRQQVNQGADILLSGGSEIPWGQVLWQQDLLVSRFQAMANRRFVVRAMKRGYSAVINPLGEVLAQSDGYHDAVVIAKVDLVSGRSPYTTIGDSGVAGALLLLLFALTLRKYGNNTLSLH